MEKYRHRIGVFQKDGDKIRTFTDKPSTHKDVNSWVKRVNSRTNRISVILSKKRA